MSGLVNDDELEKLNDDEDDEHSLKDTGDTNSKWPHVLTNFLSDPRKRSIYVCITIAFALLVVLVVSYTLATRVFIPASVGGQTTFYRTDLNSWPSNPDPPQALTLYVSWLKCKKDAGPAFIEAAKATIPSAPTGKRETALFSAGCFWEVEITYQRIPGVLETSVGYTGGTTLNPSYHQVSEGNTGHCETAQVVFDPNAVSYRQLVKIFFEQYDPTTLDQQGADYGTQYRSALFYLSEDQRKVAEEEKALAQARLGKTVVTEITPASTYWPAETYHQQYLQKHGISAKKGDTSAIPCYAF